MLKPASDAELEIASEFYFGVPLHLSKLQLFGSSGSFKVKESYDDYNRFGGNGYDLHGFFWTWVLGPRFCGGTAGSTYGQFRCSYRTQKRLGRWICSRRKGDSSSVRDAFAEVSRVINGPGENTPNLEDWGVLSNGRVDGALSSFAKWPEEWS